MGTILVTIGNESHTTSRKWANVTVNGKKLTFRDANSTDWQTSFGDKHASWCECSFTVNAGDVIIFEAGHNYGPRACNHDRTNLVLVFDPTVDVREFEVAAGSLKGRLTLKTDRLKNEQQQHVDAANNL
jgi:hypothetical protein